MRQISESAPHRVLRDQVMSFKKLMEELQAIGEVTWTVAGHSVERENFTVKVEGHTDKICFALDQPKEHKRQKAIRVSDVRNLSCLQLIISVCHLYRVACCDFCSLTCSS